MSFNSCQGVTQQNVSALELIDEIRNGMPKYPVAVIVIGSGDQKREQFIKWMDKHLERNENFTEKIFHHFKKAKEVKNFSSEKLEGRKWIDIVNVDHALTMDYGMRRMIEDKFTQRCKQVKVIWLRPNRAAHKMVSCLERDIDDALEENLPTLDGVDSLTTLYI